MNIPKPKLLKMKVNIPKVKEKKEFTVEQFTTMFKNPETISDALRETLRFLPKKERVSFTFEIVRNSKFRAFKTAMRNFEVIVERYLQTGNTEDVKTYLSNLVEDYSEYNYSRFVQVRRDILEDIIDDEPLSAFQAIEDTVVTFMENDYLDQPDFTGEYGALLKPYAAQAASLKWPEAKGLNILFGANGG